MTGKESNHRKFRRDAVDYVKNNKHDFAPFIEDDWDKFLSNLGQDLGHIQSMIYCMIYRLQVIRANTSIFFIVTDIFKEPHNMTQQKDGEFAGNEAIVALAKFHRVEIIIHQANQAVWNIDGATEQTTGQKRQLHIAYHDWEHYSSVRPKKDFSKEPAWLRISDDQSDRTKPEPQSEHENYDKDPVVSETEETESKPKKPLSGKEKKRLRMVKLISYII